MAEWQAARANRNPDFFFGAGFGSDINVDGVDHYGLYPDWIEDLRQ